MARSPVDRHEQAHRASPPDCRCDICEMGRRVRATGDTEFIELWDRVFEASAKTSMKVVGYRAALEEIADAKRRSAARDLARRFVEYGGRGA